jgi:uncharacterized protein (UPF0335 family)
VTGGSQNLRIFRRTIRDGATIDDACKASGIEITEARLTISADAKNPPPPEAFELIGHNKGPDMAETTDDRLRLLIERVERLEEEKKAIADDIKDVYGEGKSVGYDAKLMREIVKLRKMKPDDRRERDMLLDVYKAALGMDFCETPLGTAALRSVG